MNSFWPDIKISQEMTQWFLAFKSFLSFSHPRYSFGERCSSCFEPTSNNSAYLLFGLQPLPSSVCQGGASDQSVDQLNIQKAPLSSSLNPYLIFPPFSCRLRGDETSWHCSYPPDSLMWLHCQPFKSAGAVVLLVVRQDVRKPEKMCSWAQTWHTYFSSLRLHILEVASLVSTHKWIA